MQCSNGVKILHENDSWGNCFLETSCRSDLVPFTIQITNKIYMFLDISFWRLQRKCSYRWRRLGNEIRVSWVKTSHLVELKVQWKPNMALSLNHHEPGCDRSCKPSIAFYRNKWVRNNPAFSFEISHLFCCRTGNRNFFKLKRGSISKIVMEFRIDFLSFGNCCKIDICLVSSWFNMKHCLRVSFRRPSV